MTANPASATLPIAAPRASNAARKRPRNVNAIPARRFFSRSCFSRTVAPAGNIAGKPETARQIRSCPLRDQGGNDSADSAKEESREIDDRVFDLKKVLPAGMAFPYDFGFVPSTRGGDGDPLDVLVLMDEPAFPGVRLSCRVIGIIEGEAHEGKKKPERNDRVVAIENANNSYAHVQHIDDLGTTFQKELENFFVNYHGLDGVEYRILGLKGPRAARRAVKMAIDSRRR